MFQNPTLLLADEPTGNLDSKNSKDIIDLLQEINIKYNKTIILVTHDEAIAKKASRILLINDGKIIKDVNNKWEKK